MQKRTIALCGALVLAAACRSAEIRRPYFEGLAPVQQAVVVQWLNQDCGAAEGQKLVLELRKIGPVLEPVLWEAWELGRPADEVAVDREAMEVRWAERRAWLRSDEAPLLMAPEDRERFLAVSRDDWVAAELARADVGYRTAAILGLRAVGTAESSARLEAIARDPDDPAAEAARLALDELP